MLAGRDPPMSLRRKELPRFPLGLGTGPGLGGMGNRSEVLPEGPWFSPPPPPRPRDPPRGQNRPLEGLGEMRPLRTPPGSRRGLMRRPMPPPMDRGPMTRVCPRRDGGGGGRREDVGGGGGPMPGSRGDMLIGRPPMRRVGPIPREGGGGPGGGRGMDWGPDGRGCGDGRGRGGWRIPKGCRRGPRLRPDSDFAFRRLLPGLPAMAFMRMLGRFRGHRLPRRMGRRLLPLTAPLPKARFGGPRRLLRSPFMPPPQGEFQDPRGQMPGVDLGKLFKGLARGRGAPPKRHGSPL